jgi:serine/threonine protein kinase
LDQLTQAVLSISKAVLLMHSAGIVHNDIRWDNVIVHNNDYILIDFDDAYILSNAEEFCPALSHLRPSEHAKSTFIPHRFEVDIWAIGRLIVTALSNYNFGLLEQQQPLRDLGLRVMNSYTDFKLTSVIDELKIFLHC